jgi:phenylpropionate dioxygenase-like ring-hydroxylating dioxygenase large terminal subunit
MLLPGEATTPRADFVFLWPNLLLCAAPDGVAVTQVLPESAGRSLLRQVRYGLPDGSRAMRLLRYAHERVQREALRDDLRMLERAQGGAESLGADATGPIGADECATQWFVRRYVAACKPPSRRRIKSNARQRTVAESPEAAAT